LDWSSAPVPRPQTEVTMAPRQGQPRYRPSGQAAPPSEGSRPSLTRSAEQWARTALVGAATPGPDDPPCGDDPAQQAERQEEPAALSEPGGDTAALESCSARITATAPETHYRLVIRSSLPVRLASDHHDVTRRPNERCDAGGTGRGRRQAALGRV